MKREKGHGQDFRDSELNGVGRGKNPMMDVKKLSEGWKKSELDATGTKEGRHFKDGVCTWSKLHKC